MDIELMSFIERAKEEFEKSRKKFEKEGIVDSRCYNFLDECQEWLITHMEKLLDDYDRFVNEKLEDLGKECLNEEIQ